MQWTYVRLSEALLAHDVYVCRERPSGALPPESQTGRGASIVGAALQTRETARGALVVGACVERGSGDMGSRERGLFWEPLCPSQEGTTCIVFKTIVLEMALTKASTVLKMAQI